LDKLIDPAFLRAAGPGSIGAAKTTGLDKVGEVERATRIAIAYSPGLLRHFDDSGLTADLRHIEGQAILIADARDHGTEPVSAVRRGAR
jgi:hypothetical protein